MTLDLFTLIMATLVAEPWKRCGLAYIFEEGVEGLPEDRPRVGVYKRSHGMAVQS